MISRDSSRRNAQCTGLETLLIIEMFLLLVSSCVYFEGKIHEMGQDGYGELKFVPSDPAYCV